MSVVEVTRDGAVATLTVNRPDKLNALNAETIAALHAAVNELSADDAVAAVIVTGADEKAFVAGADISALAEHAGLVGNEQRWRVEYHRSGTKPLR